MRNSYNVLITYLKQMNSKDLEWFSFAFGYMEAGAEKRIEQIAEYMLKDTNLEPFFTNDCIDDPAGLNPGCEEICVLCESNDIEWPSTCSGIRYVAALPGIVYKGRANDTNLNRCLLG